MFEEMRAIINRIKIRLKRFFKLKKAPTINVNITITIGDNNRFSA